MARTNDEFDKELVTEAVSRDEALAMEGSGWDADLDELRGPTVADLG